MLGSLQHQDDEGGMRGGPIEGEGQRKGRLPRSGLTVMVDSKTAAPTTLQRERGGGRVVEGRREEGGGSLRALLARRGGVGEREDGDDDWGTA
jgi:hypothetical protein